MALGVGNAAWIAGSRWRCSSSSFSRISTLVMGSFINMSSTFLMRRSNWYDAFRSSLICVVYKAIPCYNGSYYRDGMLRSVVFQCRPSPSTVRSEIANGGWMVLGGVMWIRQIQYLESQDPVFAEDSLRVSFLTVANEHSSASEWEGRDVADRS